MYLLQLRVDKIENVSDFFERVSVNYGPFSLLSAANHQSGRESLRVSDEHQNIKRLGDVSIA